MTGEHEHRWFVQDEDEPENTYLVCIQCGEVVDPKTFLAMRALVQEVADYPEYQNEDGWLMVLRIKAQDILARRVATLPKGVRG